MLNEASDILNELNIIEALPQLAESNPSRARVTRRKQIEVEGAKAGGKEAP